MKNLKFIIKEWRKNYRYQKGIVSLARCLMGTARLLTNNSGRRERDLNPKVDCITFSVLPKLTALWAIFIEHAIPSQPRRVIVGDCSGEFCALDGNQLLTVFPLLNYPHGTKLDLFIEKVCTAEYVVVCDDDVFWLDTLPWQWAISQFESDPKISVVSLMPRDHVSSVLKDKVTTPMGSYCLILRREIWLREDLSFKIVYPPPEEGYDWFYDTADYANLELLKRGYRVVIAPPEIRKHLVTFEGISQWGLKIQESSGNIRERLDGITIRIEKAFRTILVLKGE